MPNLPWHASHFSAPGAATWVAVSGGEVVGVVHLLSNGVVSRALVADRCITGLPPKGDRASAHHDGLSLGGGKWLDLCAEPGSEAFYRSFRHQESAGFRIYPSEEL
jgi:hypothetical protein